MLRLFEFMLEAVGYLGIDDAEEVEAFGETYPLIQQAIQQNYLTQLPTVTKYPKIPLVIQ